MSAANAGPDYWNFNKQWSLCLSGKLQSPINIETDTLIYDHTLTPLEFEWHANAATTSSSAEDGKRQQVRHS